MAATAIITRFFSKHFSVNPISVPVFVYGWAADKPFTDMINAFFLGNDSGSMKLHVAVQAGEIILLVNTLTGEEKQCRVVHVNRGGRTNVVSLLEKGEFWTHKAEADRETTL